MQALTMRELCKYNVGIARIPDSGHSVIKVPGEEDCYHLYHSGVVDNNERHSVALALNEASKTALQASMSILPHLASARLKGTTVSLTVVAVYASTLDATEKAKDSVERVPAGDMFIVAGY